MTSRTICMKQAREAITQLSLKNSSIRRASNITGLSRTAVKNIKSRLDTSEKPINVILGFNDSELREFIYRTSKNKGENKRYADLVMRLPGIMVDLTLPKENSLHIWEKYLKENPDGYSYSQFCCYISRARAKTEEVVSVIEHKYGDKIFIDYAGDPINYTSLDGELHTLQTFISILPGSHRTYVGVSRNQKTESWIEQSTKALEYFGGVPKVIIPDCAKAVVTKACKYEPVINDEFKRFANHYGLTVVPARPGKPKDKALVENAVNNIYRYIYPRLNDKHCRSVEEIEYYLRLLVDSYNKRVMRKYNKSRNELFELYEKEYLLPLSPTRYQYQRYQAPRKIGPTSHIFLKEDKHYYSVPERFRGHKCEIYYTLNAVLIYCESQRICTHPRNTGANQYTTVESHLSGGAKKYFAYSQSSAEEKALEFSLEVCALVKGVYREQAHHLQAQKSVFGIFNLAKTYSKKRFVIACSMAVSDEIFKYTAVKNILENNFDLKNEEQLEFNTTINSHENLRHTNKKEIQND